MFTIGEILLTRQAPVSNTDQTVYKRKGDRGSVDRSISLRLIHCQSNDVYVCHYIFNNSAFVSGITIVMQLKETKCIEKFKI